MRFPRLKTRPDSSSPAHYHCLSRVVDRQFLFLDPEKAHFIKLLRETSAFCRVRVLSFAILSNHFHILLEVPPKPSTDRLPSPEEIVRDLRKLSGHQFPGAVEQRFRALRDAGDPQALSGYLATFHARMFDVSSFMKLLKQRFTQWYNARHHRRGTLWEERFKSVLVQGEGHALLAMAAYIDLNPVRAGIVRDPRDYPFCSYGQAVAGDPLARRAVQALAETLERGRPRRSPGESMALYRQWLYLTGDGRREATLPDGRTVRGALPSEKVEEVLRAKGRLPAREYVRCRVRYFCDGAVLGGKEWVEGLFRQHRSRFGSRRTTGARRMRGLVQSDALYTWRDLQKEVFGPRQHPLAPRRRPV